MAENLQKKPSKGILKNSSSFDQQDAQHHRKSKETKWDEMNIIATLHPADKDYGHMKIDEPKTPYNYDEPDSSKDLDPDALAEKLQSDKPAKVLEEVDDDDDEEEEDEELTPEEKALRKEFEMKRKAHYNEYYAVKLARKLLEEDDEDDDDDENNEDTEKTKQDNNKPDDNAGTSGCAS